MIFICTHKGSPFLQDCLASIPGGIPTVVIRGYQYEVGALRWIQENFQGESFLFLQDSTRVKNPDWLYSVLQKKGVSVSLNYEPCWFGMYMGLYRTEVLRKLVLPCVETKMDAVLAEISVGKDYERHETSMEILWPDFTLDNATHDNIYGRNVMVYENEHFIKYKGCWSGDHVDTAQSRDTAARQENQ